MVTKHYIEVAISYLLLLHFVLIISYLNKNVCSMYFTIRYNSFIFVFIQNYGDTLHPWIKEKCPRQMPTNNIAKTDICHL